jgi:hypothetical protein
VLRNASRSMCTSNWVLSVAFWRRLCRLTEDGSVRTSLHVVRIRTGLDIATPTRHQHEEARSAIESTETQHRYCAKSRMNRPPDVRGHVLTALAVRLAAAATLQEVPRSLGPAWLWGRHRGPGTGRSGPFLYSIGEVSPRIKFEPKHRLLVTNWPIRYPPARAAASAE